MTVQATFTVKLSKASTLPVTVNYTTVDGTATAGSDYESVSGVLNFAAGQIEKRVAVTVNDRLAGTPDEWFTIKLSSPTNAVLANDSAKCTIKLPELSLYNGPLIKNGLMANAFHSEYGRGGYFHPYSGTSEGQSIGIEGALLAYEQLRKGTPTEQAAADWYKEAALSMLDALGDGTQQGAMLRQPISDNPKTITLLHWLFAARGPIPSQGINYDYKASEVNGKIIIPATVPAGTNGEAHRGAADVFRIWKAYPADSYLLYNSPYSPAYATQNPTGDTSIDITDADWQLVGDHVELTIPNAPNLAAGWKIIYGYNNAGTIPQGSAQEAYPCWTLIDDGYAACAPDTFRWFDYAMNLAIQYDDRTGRAAKWTSLRNAMRRTAVRGQALSDLREVIKPLPQFPVIAIKGEPSGMFCYSDHPAATRPSPEEIAQGANQAWLGYNFWSRVGGVNGEVVPGDFVWTPQNMFNNPDNGNYFNGAIKCTVPEGKGQVQIGRGVNDEWRVGNAFQEDDQFLFLAIAVSKLPASGENIYVYLSSTKYYAGTTRYYADISRYASLVAEATPTKPCYLLIPRTDFKRKDFDSAVMPAGTRFENFGLSFEMAGPYTAHIVAMRLVSGQSAAWVQANTAKAVAGSVMPFFPGAMPFAINADTKKQQFVGWNGSPFHGYQLPDYWSFLETDAEAVHGALSAGDLPVPGTTGVQYPILAKTAGGDTKHRAALLMEQQLMFLKAAQDKYAADGGPAGPFAHTFVLNTPARMSLGNPTPNSWVYVNDDPNTRWLGYQCRVVDALSKLTYLTAAKTVYDTARDMALAMAMKWLERINILWPNLNGKPYADPEQGDILIHGMPTDFDDPRKSAPTTTYEEPHGPSLILRACLWLKLSGKLTTDQVALVDTVGKRCWDYLEMRYRTGETDTMRYTWANSSPSNTEQWYGFWHFEIIATISYLLQNPAGVPTGIDVATLRQRLVETRNWLQNNAG